MIYNDGIVNLLIGDKLMEQKWKIKSLADIIIESDNIVVFTGAGVSTESKIPDFRSDEGLFQNNKKYPYPPEEMLSHSFWKEHTKLFYQYYFENMIYEDAQPNDAHLAIAKLEKMGKVKAVVTQNIDGLHQKGDSKRVLELHGSIDRNFCVNCGQSYTLEEILKQRYQIPVCRICGSIIKPDVVLYEEPLKQKVIEQSVESIIQADTMIIMGTSLVVYPAAGFVNYFKGKSLVLINKSFTPYDSKANLIINEKAGQTMTAVMKIISNY